MIQKICQSFERERFVFVPGSKIEKIIRKLGASDLDIAQLPSHWCALPTDPTLPFRQSANGRYCFDYGENTLCRMTQQGFRLDQDEDFLRHDSGTVRFFEPIPDPIQENSAYQALLTFKAIVTGSFPVAMRKKLDSSSIKRVCTVFALRTITNKYLQGEPAAEGVHSDGVEHTMTTFIGSTNMSGNSAISSIHLNEQCNGDVSQALEKYQTGKIQHRHFLDTLIIADSERKHSVSSLLQASSSDSASRDMLIFFTRHPCLPTHGSWKIDPIEECALHPMRIKFDLEVLSND